MTVSEYNKSVDQFADGLYRYALKLTKDEDTAKDLVQDTFEKVWLKHTEVAFDKSKSYLFTTLYHSFVDHSRRAKKSDSIDEVDPHDHLHQSQYSDLQEILHEALDKLPQIQKSVILLRDYEGYEYKEIGEITGLNESQVKVYIFRARTFLKQYLGSIEAVA